MKMNNRPFPVQSKILGNKHLHVWYKGFLNCFWTFLPIYVCLWQTPAFADKIWGRSTTLEKTEQGSFHLSLTLSESSTAVRTQVACSDSLKNTYYTWPQSVIICEGVVSWLFFLVTPRGIALCDLMPWFISSLLLYFSLAEYFAPMALSWVKHSTEAWLTISTKSSVCRWDVKVLSLLISCTFWIRDRQ